MFQACSRAPKPVLPRDPPSLETLHGRLTEHHPCSAQITRLLRGKVSRQTPITEKCVPMFCPMHNTASFPITMIKVDHTVSPPPKQPSYLKNKQIKKKITAMQLKQEIQHKCLHFQVAFKEIFWQSLQIMTNNQNLMCYVKCWEHFIICRNSYQNLTLY